MNATQLFRKDAKMLENSCNFLLQKDYF